MQIDYCDSCGTRITTADRRCIGRFRGIPKCAVAGLALFPFSFFLFPFVALRAAEPPSPLLAHWKFDGNTEDAEEKHKRHGVAQGRVEFFDSPIGGAGQLLSLNGVDAFVQVDAAGLNIGSDGFSVSLWMFPLELRNAGIIGNGGGKDGKGGGWSLRLGADGAVVLEFFSDGKPAEVLRTAGATVAAGQWSHLVLSIPIAIHGGDSKMWINGISSASAVVKTRPADTTGPLLIGKRQGDKVNFNGLLDNVIVFDSAVDERYPPVMTDAGLPWIRPKPRMNTPFGEKFVLEPDDVAVLVGGENALAAAEAGYFETLLALAHPADTRFYFRNMAWEGDTVFEQWRILNFGPWKRQFERTGASVIFVQFGQMESLQGAAGLPKFIAAYEKLLDEFTRRTQRIVLLSPTPFGPGSAGVPPAGETSAAQAARNEVLRQYVEAIKSIAQKRKLLFVDLYSALEPAVQKGAPVVCDGPRLTAAGQWLAAKAAADQLGFGHSAYVPEVPKKSLQVQADGAFHNTAAEKLRRAFQRKNRLWLNYWRPGNWAFLYGDRVPQPSSRDHRDARVRWFPAEVEQYQGLIAREERKIEGLRAEIAHRLGAEGPRK